MQGGWVLNLCRCGEDEMRNEDNDSLLYGEAAWVVGVDCDAVYDDDGWCSCRTRARR